MNEQIPLTFSPMSIPEAAPAPNALLEREQRSVPAGRVAGALLLSAALLGACAGDKAPRNNPSTPASAEAPAASGCNDGLAEGSVFIFRSSEEVRVRELGQDTFDEVFGGTGGMLPVKRPTTRATTKATTRTVAPAPATTKPVRPKPTATPTKSATPSPTVKPSKTKTSAPIRGGELPKINVVEVETVGGPCRVADVPQTIFMDSAGLDLPPVEGQIYVLQSDIKGRTDTPD